MPATTVVGSRHTVTIRAVNAAGQTVSNLSGTVTLTSSDGTINIPVLFPAKNTGLETASVTFTALGSKTLIASSGDRTGTESNILVVSQATLLGVSVSSATVTAGGSITLTVKGLTSAKKVDPLFADLLNVVPSDPNATVVFVPEQSGNGVETFTVTFDTTGKQTIAVTDLSRPTIKGAAARVLVNPAPATQLVVTGLPLFALASGSESFTVTAEDSFGNRVTSGFHDKVAVAGQSYTFQTNDQGRHLFQKVTLPAGMQTLTASDSTNANVTAGPPVSIDVVTSAVSVGADPLDSAHQALIILAPAGGKIILTPTNAAGTSIQVTQTVGSRKTTFGPFPLSTSDHIIVYGQSGNNDIEEQTATISGTPATIAVPAILLGGSKPNTLSVAGSSASNILVGGAGSDTLTGGIGRDILIGRGGADTLRAGSGGSVLIGGSTTLDANLQALAAVLAEWDNSNDSYATRVQDLLGIATGGPNGNTLLDEASILKDAAINHLFGGSGQDWFWLELTDKLSGVRAGTVVTAN